MVGAGVSAPVGASAGLFFRGSGAFSPGLGVASTAAASGVAAAVFDDPADARGRSAVDVSGFSGGGTSVSQSTPPAIATIRISKSAAGNRAAPRAVPRASSLFTPMIAFPI